MSIQRSPTLSELAILFDLLKNKISFLDEKVQDRIIFLSDEQTDIITSNSRYITQYRIEAVISHLNCINMRYGRCYDKIFNNDDRRDMCCNRKCNICKFNIVQNCSGCICKARICTICTEIGELISSNYCFACHNCRN